MSHLLFNNPLQLHLDLAQNSHFKLPWTGLAPASAPNQLSALSSMLFPGLKEKAAKMPTLPTQTGPSEILMNEKN